MKFDKILDNNTLWAVHYDEAKDNALQTLFDQWSDPEWLVDFFIANMSDQTSYFKITDVNQAIYWCDQTDTHHARKGAYFGRAQEDGDSSSIPS